MLDAAPFFNFFSGSSSFFFFADRSSALTGAQKPLSLTNASRGPLFSHPRGTLATGLPFFFFFFPADHFRSLQVWNLLFTMLDGPPPLFLNSRALRLSAHERGAQCRSQLVRLSFSFSSFFHLLTNFSLLPASPSMRRPLRAPLNASPLACPLNASPQCIPPRVPPQHAHSTCCPLRTPLSHPTTPHPCRVDLATPHVAPFSRVASSCRHVMWCASLSLVTCLLWR